MQRHGIAALLSLIFFSFPANAQIASVYSTKYCNRPTASGERLNCSAMTAAMRAGAFGSSVKVTNLKNKRSIVVRIVDRGPFVRGRVIDLTPGAARALGFSGLAHVSVQSISRRADLDTDISASRRHHAHHRHRARGHILHRHHFAHRHPVRHDARATAGLGNTGGMNGAFVAKLHSLNGAMPSGSSCAVGSGFRSHSQQAALHAAKPGLAARPGHSNHERGLAADLSCRGRGLAFAHSNASRFGLRFPMSYEPWHIEPQGATRVAHRHIRIRFAMRRLRHMHGGFGG